jgi:hypothetical protein
VRLLDFIRKRRSQIRLALQPAPAEIEAGLLNEREIAARLRQEIAAAQHSGHGPWPSVKQANLEAAQLFKPVLKATQHLAQELAGHERITVITRDHEVELALGQERRIRASPHGSAYPIGLGVTRRFGRHALARGEAGTMDREETAGTADTAPHRHIGGAPCSSS